MSFSAIHNALNTQLLTTPNLPTIQEENNRVKLGSGNTPWCRTTFLPTQSVVSTFGVQGMTKLNGLFQVDLFYPMNTSYETAYTMVDTIVGQFIPGKVLNNSISIMNSYALPMRDLPISERTMPNYYIVSVMIQWQEFEQRPIIT